jgi:hypothetical protein
MPRTATPLSPGALPAANVVGGPPSACAKLSSPISNMMSARIHGSAFDMAATDRLRKTGTSPSTSLDRAPRQPIEFHPSEAA